jgi:uncharacterized protein DUF3159
MLGRLEISRLQNHGATFPERQEFLKDARAPLLVLHAAERQQLVRLAVFVPLYAAGQVVALGVARVALTWPLVAACLAVSWWVIRRGRPDGHPGLRHPAGDPARTAG